LNVQKIPFSCLLKQTHCSDGSIHEQNQTNSPLLLSLVPFFLLSPWTGETRWATKAMPFSLSLRSPSPFTFSLRSKDEMDGGVAEDIVVLVEHCLPALLERGRSRGGASPLIMMIVSGGGSDLSSSSSPANSCQRSSPHPAPSFFPRGFPCMGERRTEFRF
jgi:hypothetical protein